MKWYEGLVHREVRCMNTLQTNDWLILNSKKEKEGILVANKYTFFDNPCDINYFFILLIILKMVRKSRGSNYFNTIFFTLLFPAKNLTYIPYHPL